jgi:hypothetical protein
VSGVGGCLPVIVAALEGLLVPVKYPWACSRRDISAGLITPYLCCLTVRTSDPGNGEFGLEDGRLEFSSIADVGPKLSNCLEYLLLAGGVGIARLPEFGGRGEPVEEGVYAKASKPAKESYLISLSAKGIGSTHPISLFLVGVCFRSEFLNAQK